MRASVASLSKKFISTFFAATLALGLVPAAAFAANDENSEAADAARIETENHVISGETTEAETPHVIPNTPTSVIPSDSEESALPIQNGEAPADSSGEDAMMDKATGSDALSIPAATERINETQPLQVVAQQESTRSYFLAQTLESTRTVPMVSAQLPVDTGTLNDDLNPDDPDADRVISTEGPKGPSGETSAESTVIGSFTYRGITYAVEPGGESVAVVAADCAKLPEDFIEVGAIVLPSVVTPDNIDNYSVTRIADFAFSSVKLEEGEDGIPIISIPASIMTIDGDAFTGFDTLQYAIVSEDNLTYSQYDGCLYTADQTSLLLIPEGRLGAVWIAPSVTEIDPEVFSHCPSVDALVADPDSAAFQLLSTNDDRYKNMNNEPLSVLTLKEAKERNIELFLPEELAISTLNDVESSMSSTSATLDAGARFSYGASIPLASSGGYTVTIDPNGGVFSYKGTNYTEPVVFTGVGRCSPYSQTHIQFYPYGQVQQAYVTTGVVSSAPIGYKWAGYTGMLEMDANYTTVTSQNLYADGTIKFKWTPTATTKIPLASSGGYTVTIDPNGGVFSYKGTNYTEPVVFTGVGSCAPYSQTHIQFYPYGQVQQAYVTTGVVSSAPIGYHWAGYTGAIEMDANYTTVTSKGLPRDGSIIFKWAPNTYKRTCVTTRSIFSDGTTENVQNVTYDKWEHADVAPRPVAIPGYTFTGFWTSASGGTCLYTPYTETLAVAVSSSEGYFKNTRVWIYPGDLKLYSQWQVHPYSIEFSAHGENVSDLPERIATEYDQAVTLGKPRRIGYEFKNWNTAEDGSGTAWEVGTHTNLGGKLNNNETVELHAQWIEHTYNISFNANGTDLTSLPEKINAKYDATVTLSAPVRPGYTFLGWDTQEDGDGTRYEAGKPYAKLNLTDKDGAEIPLYAQWSENTYNIAYDLNDGTGTLVDTHNELYTASDTMPLSATRRGWTLIGWSKTSYTDDAMASLTTLPAGDWKPGTPKSVKDMAFTGLPSANNSTVKLYAVWELNNYSITLNHTGGAFSWKDLASLRTALGSTGSVNDPGTSISYTVRTKDFALPQSTRSGFTFQKWIDESGNTVQLVKPSDANFELESCTFKVVWATTGYFLELVNADASQAYPSPVFEDPDDAPELGFDKAMGEDYEVVLKVPYRKGYDFSGWTGPGIEGVPKMTVTVHPNTLIAVADANGGKLTYTAHWTQRNYTVTYVLNDTDDNYEGTFASAYTGFNSTAPQKQADGTYIDTYRYDETNTASLMMLPNKTGDAFDLTRPGYVFAGWKRADDDSSTVMNSIDPTSSAKDMTFKAIWNPVASVTLPAATTPATIGFVLDRATGNVQEVVEGRDPQTLRISSTTPVDCELYARSEAGGFDIANLFEPREAASASDIANLVASMGFVFATDGKGLVDTDTTTLSFLHRGAEVGTLKVKGSEQFASKGSSALGTVNVDGTLKLAQKNGASFDDISVDTSKISIKSMEQLPQGPLTFANIIWTVSLPATRNA